MTRILFSALVCAVVKVKKKAHDAWPQHTMMLNYKLFPRTMHNRELCQSKKEKEKLLLNGERVNELFIRFTATLICPEQTMAFDLILNGDSWTPQECSNAIVLLFFSTIKRHQNDVFKHVLLLRITHFNYLLRCLCDTLLLSISSVRPENEHLIGRAKKQWTNSLT